MFWRAKRKGRKRQTRDFPGSLLVKNPRFHAGGMGLIPDQETKIPHVAWHGRKK